VDPLNRKTAYDYDAAGKLVAMTDAGGHQTRWEHDERGLVIAIHDAHGGISRLNYNLQAQVIAYIDCSGSETRYEYDADGLLTAIVNAMGERTTLRHDAAGNVIRHELADGTFETYGYDEADRVVSIENGLGARTSYAYAPDGLVTERRDACGSAVRYDYDKARRLVKLTNENGAVYTFVYDPLGRKLQETRFDGTCIRYRYDEAGGLLETIEAPDSAQPIRTLYRTDALGRIVQSETAHSQSNVDYDEAGQLVKARRDGIEVQLAHDALGRVVEERLIAPGHTHVIRHAYDALGNRLETVLPGGTTIGALHYGSGHVHQIMLDGEPLADVIRDRLHRQIERTQGGLTVRWSYDPAGRPQSRTVAGLRGDAAIDRHCAHDIAGRLLSATMGARQHHYQFDALDRLTGFDAQRFDFDPAHNLLPPGQRTPFADNRVVRGAQGGYKHDAHGRVVEKQIDARTTLHLAWDGQHRLAESLRVGPQGPVRTRYLYDAFGRRVAKQDDEGIVWFAWDGDRLVGELGPRVERLFIYEPDTHMPLAQVARVVSPGPGAAASAVYFYHCEDNGLPVAMTDVQGRMRWRGTATAWGALADQWWSDEQGGEDAATAPPRAEPCLRFMGQYADQESGLHYNQHRYFDPDIASFLSHDPLGLLGSENTFTYPANPLQLVDPLGLVIVYHYTTKAGYNAITSGKVYQFKVSKPSKEGKPKGVYVSPLGPQDLCAKDYKAKLGVTREKSEYYIAFSVDSAKLRPIPGGRGAHVLYAPEDLFINRDNVVGQGETPKKKC
jgi:RHS repeat-associated protein